MACRAPPLSAALHADLGELAEPRRALVCRAAAEAAAARSAPLGARAQHRHPRLDRHLQPQPSALCLDQDRRPDPRIDRALLHANQRLTTLAMLGRGWLAGW